MHEPRDPVVGPLQVPRHLAGRDRLLHHGWQVVAGGGATARLGGPGGTGLAGLPGVVVEADLGGRRGEGGDLRRRQGHLDRGARVDHQPP